MEDYFTLGVVVLGIAAFVPCIFFAIRAAHQFVLMLGHRRVGAAGLAGDLLPFIAPLFPQAFTDQGNVHRRAFLVNLNWALCFAALIGMVFAFVGISGA
jgi:hypothetical protein